DDPCRDGDALRLEIGAAVTAEHQDRGRERLPGIGGKPVDEQPLALANAILLASEGDDCVAVGLGRHSVENAGFGAREARSLAEDRAHPPLSSHWDIGTYSQSVRSDAGFSV